MPGKRLSWGKGQPVQFFAVPLDWTGSKTERKCYKRQTCFSLEPSELEISLGEDNTIRTNLCIRVPFTTKQKDYPFEVDPDIFP